MCAPVCLGVWCSNDVCVSTAHNDTVPCLADGAQLAAHTSARCAATHYPGAARLIARVCVLSSRAAASCADMLSSHRAGAAGFFSGMLALVVVRCGGLFMPGSVCKRAAKKKKHTASPPLHAAEPSPHRAFPPWPPLKEQLPLSPAPSPPLPPHPPQSPSPTPSPPASPRGRLNSLPKRYVVTAACSGGGVGG